MMRTILRSLMVKLLTAMAVATGIGLGVGVWLQARLEEKLHALRFEQPEIDLRQRPAVEGEPIEVVAQLHNFGKVPVRITNMATCCGARIIRNEDETTLTEIAPGASMPIHLQIGTLLGSGEAIKRLQVEGQTADGLELAPAELVVFTYIMATLAAYPESTPFILHEDELSAPIKQTIALADLWPGDGLKIKSITSTLGDKLRYQLVPAHGEVGNRSVACSGTNVMAKTWTMLRLTAFVELQISPARRQAGCRTAKENRPSGRCLPLGRAHRERRQGQGAVRCTGKTRV
jgi:hypothetical protein